MPSGSIVAEHTKHILPKIPTLDSASDIVDDLPDPALQFGALLNACHAWFPVGSIVLFLSMLISRRN
jgi:hypothetical protein